jgi:hypothetical protein
VRSEKCEVLCVVINYAQGVNDRPKSEVRNQKSETERLRLRQEASQSILASGRGDPSQRLINLWLKPLAGGKPVLWPPVLEK